MSNPSSILGDAKAAARAIDALRRGWRVTVRGADGALTLLPIERVGDPSVFAAAREVLLSASRAATLKLMGEGVAAACASAVRIEAPEDMAGPDGAALKPGAWDPTTGQEVG